MKKIIIFCSFLLVVLSVSAEMLDSLSVSVLDSCLTYLHLDPSELGFEKAWVKDDTFKLKVIDHLLDNPLDLPEYVEETVDEADQNWEDPVKFLEYASSQLDAELGDIEIENPGSAFVLLENAMIEAEKYREKALQDLDELELHDLIMSTPGLWADENDPRIKELAGSWQCEFKTEVDTSRVVDKDRILNIIKKIDRTSLNTSGMIFAGIIWEIYQNADWNKQELVTPNHVLAGMQGEMLAHWHTDFGDIVIGGKGDNVYNYDYAVIIDLGGTTLIAVEPVEQWENWEILFQQ